MQRTASPTSCGKCAFPPRGNFRSPHSVARLPGLVSRELFRESALSGTSICRDCKAAPFSESWGSATSHLTPKSGPADNAPAIHFIRLYRRTRRRCLLLFASTFIRPRRSWRWLRGLPFFLILTRKVAHAEQQHYAFRFLLRVTLPPFAYGRRVGAEFISKARGLTFKGAFLSSRSVQKTRISWAYFPSCLSALFFSLPLDRSISVQYLELRSSSRFASRPPRGLFLRELS